MEEKYAKTTEYVVILTTDSEINEDELIIEFERQFEDAPLEVQGAVNLDPQSNRDPSLGPPLNFPLRCIHGRRRPCPDCDE
ncbi:hypothetical protein [Natrinema salaciae]|uniref:hypothetical protein n=1 Tax=Natrinema salaciae TaxID=1186196 RepID=UPI001113963C|nr:hypothetical protein [Natrinema salaciae]